MDVGLDSASLDLHQSGVNGQLRTQRNEIWRLNGHSVDEATTYLVEDRLGRKDVENSLEVEILEGKNGQ